MTSDSTSVISTVSEPTAGGVTTGGGTYGKGDSVTISATANQGYSFVKWKNDNGVEYGTETVSFKMPSSGMTWTAYFSNQDGHLILRSHDLFYDKSVPPVEGHIILRDA